MGRGCRARVEALDKGLNPVVESQHVIVAGGEAGGAEEAPPGQAPHVLPGRETGVRVQDQVRESWWGVQAQGRETWVGLHAQVRSHVGRLAGP